MNSPPCFPIRFFLITYATSLLCLAQVDGAEETQPNIPRIEFKDTPLSEAIEFFRTSSIKLHPLGKRINFVVDSKVDQNQKITLRLNDIPIGVAVIYMIDYADLDYRIDAHACFVLPRGQGELAKRRPPNRTETANYVSSKRARQVVLEKFEFIDAPIGDVIEYIAERSAEKLSNKVGVNLVINRYIDLEIPVSVQLANMPISEILSSIATIAELEIRIEPHAIFLDPPGTKALQWARIKTAQLAGRKAAPQRPRTGGAPYYRLGVYPNDPRSTVHPDYVDSNHPNISKRTNALDNVYKWVGGKWTFVRKGSADLGESPLDTNKGGGL